MGTSGVGDDWDERHKQRARWMTYARPSPGGWASQPPSVERLWMICFAVLIGIANPMPVTGARSGGV
ncbi:hypothetical protein SAMN05421678_102296 [Actinopolymorpha cephalotaxi]|uniref:Uncharacterized protein n=1 Tax=Actinopolymorpha cephalotaxi TaxID=504797 RepID=A0A1I2LYU7_9ACTN|nr:hypothetical protein SAMN05421678_102296 [Actinopolymorpha cephalotaxi]